MHNRFAFALAGIALISVSACDRLRVDATEPEAPIAAVVVEPVEATAPPAPFEEKYEWLTIEPSQVVDGNPASLSLSDGYAYAYFPETAVFPGDVLKVKFSASGDADRVVTAILQRHCDGENGDDAKFHSFRLTDTPTPQSFEHTFAASYGCIRLSFMIKLKA